ncbi:ATP synthase gamma chain [Candidatus Photodesmus katoptron Akat1]|uniref:ATP synthase gamma chain n=1 Tax=Candidatus Photodesmus katoptron Akat1 TaxID=1236703 RepID=S3DIJ6_9GAMM|nr:ATP synthase gamma chain [Candidatus Photodesmus katoptron Akat1]
MTNPKEIHTKISSVRSTKKITKAMEMVAASKMRRSQKLMEASRPYSEEISKVINHITQSDRLDLYHPYLEKRTARSVGYIVISTDRGLCGGLNINLFKQTLIDIQKKSRKGANIQLSIIGLKASSFFKKHIGAKVIAQLSGLGNRPSLESIIGSVGVMLKKYDSGELDQLFLVFNRFINTMIQKPKIKQLLPLSEDKDNNNDIKKVIHGIIYMNLALNPY